jgi:hypothetical protein
MAYGQESDERAAMTNGNDLPTVHFISGRARRRKGEAALGIHILLAAPDDDTAVRRALESLASEGFAEAEIDRIGDLLEAPLEEPHLSAWQGALEGEIAIITFEDPFGDD